MNDFIVNMSGYSIHEHNRAIAEHVDQSLFLLYDSLHVSANTRDMCIMQEFCWKIVVFAKNELFWNDRSEFRN